MSVIISIEGNIGSGKSTLVTELKQYFNDTLYIEFLQEPVDIWSTIKDENGITILEKFYEDNEKYAFQFQMMAYISRLSIIKNALKTNKYKYIITERSLYTDANIFAKMLYDDKKISLIEYTIYKMWFDEFISDIPITKIIYVKADPSVSCQRVIKRNRIGENIPLSYLEKCHDYHEKWLTNSKYDMITLDGNNDITQNPTIMKGWIKQIETFININDTIEVEQLNELEYSSSSDTDNEKNDNDKGDDEDADDDSSSTSDETYYDQMITLLGKK